ncbi:Hypothetical predicted protein, partial [Olea europaea subsp. europaea]
NSSNSKNSNSNAPKLKPNEPSWGLKDQRWPQSTSKTTNKIAPGKNQKLTNQQGVMNPKLNETYLAKTEPVCG